MTFKEVRPIPIIENELYDDEELFWWGQPTGWHFIRGQDIPQIGMGLVTAVFGTGFYLFTRNMIAGFSFSGPGASNFDFVRLMFTIVPLFFVLNGLTPIATVIIRWMSQKRTYYGVTNKRALIITDTFSRRVRSFYDAQIEGIESVQHRNGTGDVYFASEQVTRRWNTRNGGFFIGGSYNSHRPYVTQERIGFLGISNVREVEDLMTQLFIESDMEESLPRKRKAKQDSMPEDGKHDSFAL